MSDDLTALTIKDASRLLRLGTISAADLVTAHVERIERVDPHVKAYLRFTPELWEKQADEAEVEGILGRRVRLGYRPHQPAPGGLLDLLNPTPRPWLRPEEERPGQGPRPAVAGRAPRAAALAGNARKRRRRQPSGPGGMEKIAWKPPRLNMACPNTPSQGALPRGPKT